MKRIILILNLVIMSLFSCTFGPPSRFAPEIDFSGQELPIAEAIYERDKSKLKTLLDRKTTDLNKPAKSGMTYLVYAVLCDNYKIVQLLLENGADPNIVAPYVRLHSASPEYLEKLPKYEKEPLNMLPLEVATQGESDLKLIKLLVKYGADINDGRARLPIGRAIDARDMEKVKYLLQCGADINKGDYDTYPPVLTAALSRNWDMVEFLIDHGAEPMRADKRGTTVQYWIQDAIDMSKGKLYPEIKSVVKRYEALGVKFTYTSEKK